MNGEERVYMQLFYPMSILCTSDDKELAFDFVMYYNNLEELLAVGDTPDAYGKAYYTQAIFSVYETLLKKQIFESERPYRAVKAKDEKGVVLEGKFEECL